MTCDEFLCQSGKPNRYYVVTARPSDKSELVDVMAFCEDHEREQEPRSLEDLKASWHDYSVATREVFEAYIESPEAAKRGHLFLTLGPA